MTPNRITEEEIMIQPISQRFSMTYGKKESKVLVPLEFELMDVIGCSRGTVHKKGVIVLWNQLVKSKMPLIVWGRSDEYQSQYRPRSNAQGTPEEVENETRSIPWGKDPRRLFNNLWEEEKMNAQELQLQYLDQAKNANQKRMRRYVETLRQVANADGTKPDNSSADRFTFTLQPNKIYFVRTPDHVGYYRTVYLKVNPFTSNIDTLISNPIFGSDPVGMQEVSPEQVMKRVRELNTQSLNAFKSGLIWWILKKQKVLRVR
jgi:hypothetical protein